MYGQTGCPLLLPLCVLTLLLMCVFCQALEKYSNLPRLKFHFNTSLPFSPTHILNELTGLGEVTTIVSLWLLTGFWFIR